VCSAALPDRVDGDACVQAPSLEAGFPGWHRFAADVVARHRAEFGECAPAGSAARTRRPTSSSITSGLARSPVVCRCSAAVQQLEGRVVAGADARGPQSIAWGGERGAPWGPLPGDLCVPCSYMYARVRRASTEVVCTRAYRSRKRGRDHLVDAAVRDGAASRSRGTASDPSGPNISEAPRVEPPRGVSSDRIQTRPGERTTNTQRHATSALSPPGPAFRRRASRALMCRYVRAEQGYIRCSGATFCTADVSTNR